jgi:AcrR family transcriptional regulator
VSRRLPRAEREQQVMAAARRLFAERGYATVTMDDVAAEVGVTKPLLYTYFGNKEQLYLDCMGPAADALITTVGGAVAAAADPADALARGTRAFFAFIEADREAWRVLFDGTLPGSGAVGARVHEYRERLAAGIAQTLLARLPARSRARAASEVEALSHALLGASEALGRWWLRTASPLPAAAAADLLIETIEPGLRARTGVPA